jgi:hypothetical protein
LGYDTWRELRLYRFLLLVARGFLGLLLLCDTTACGLPPFHSLCGFGVVESPHGKLRLEKSLVELTGEWWAQDDVILTVSMRWSCTYGISLSLTFEKAMCPGVYSS